MRVFFPTNPSDPVRTNAERRAWEDELKAEARRRQIETRRYWITTGIAIAGFLLATVSLTWQIIAALSNGA